jgi:hypothetical protein
MREDPCVEKEWAKHPEIPPEAQKPIEDVYRKAFGISGQPLADQVETFAEAFNVAVSAGGLTDQYKNQAKAHISPNEKALRRSVRLVRFVQHTIASRGLNPSHIDWGIVLSEYNREHPKAQMKSPAVLRASYGRAIADPRVKEKLFDKEYSEYGEAVKEIVLNEEEPRVAELAMKAAFYDLAKEYGEVVVSGTVIATRAKMGLSLDKQSVVSFSEPAKEGTVKPQSRIKEGGTK